MTYSDLKQIAAGVVARAGRDLPANDALRNELKSRRGLSREEGAWISRAVFACLRWRGWLDQDQPSQNQIDRALKMADAFKADPDSFSDDELIARAVPPWIHQQLEVNAVWVRTLQTEPRLWLRARRDRGPALAEALGTTRLPSLPNAMLYEGQEDLFRCPEFQAGEFEIQDVASQAVGLLGDPKPGQVWWDACAGEGGKTLHLSELMENKGLIWASDRAAWRLAVLKRRAARAGCFNYRSALWHGGAKLPTRTTFDGVLIDAPCTGVGTWQRNPHARWTTTLEDVDELSEIQERLLAHAAPAVKPGGKLIYAVCTLTRAETLKVVGSFEGRFPDFKPLRMANPFAPSVEETRLWLWPDQTGGNGMFVAAWRRS